MTTVNKALIGILVAQLALAALTLTRGESTHIGKLEPIVAAFDAKGVSRIEIFKEPVVGNSGDKDGNKASDAAIVLHKKDNAWALATHHDYPADKSKVDSLLQKVAGLNSRGPVATSPGRQSQLSVSETEYKRKLVIHTAGGGAPITLYVGDPAGSRKTAVRLSGRDEIHGVTGFSMASISAFVSGWVDTQYFTVTESEVASITVRNAAGELTLERDSGSWKLSDGQAPGQTPGQPPGQTPGQPPGQTPGQAPGQTPGQAPGQTPGQAPDRPIDSEVVDNIVKQMTNIRLAEPADPNKAVDKPLATVTLRMKIPDSQGSDAGPPAMSVVADEYTFQIGPEDDDSRYYLRRSGDSRAVWVYASNLKPVIEFDRDKLYKTDSDDK